MASVARMGQRPSALGLWVRAAQIAPSARRAPAALIVLFVLCSYAGSAYMTAKYLALSYHERDFTFYLQFSRKLLDPSLSPRYSMSPGGYNFIGFRGVEGSMGLLKTLHFEPIKYLDAVVHHLFATQLAVFVLHSLLFSAPLLYLAFIVKRLDRRSAILATLAYAVYAFLPQNLECVSYDLRPFSLLAPLVLAQLTAIVYARPFPEILLLTNGMFLLREEALVLAIPLILFYVANEWASGRRVRRSHLAWFAACWLVWALIIAGYYFWTGFELQPPEYDNLLLYASQIGIVPLASLAAALGVAVVHYRRALWRRLSWLSLGLFAAPLLIEFAELRLPYRTLLQVPETLLSEPRWHLLFILVLGALLYSGRRAESLRLRNMLVSAAVVALSLAVSLCFVGRSAPLSEYRVYRARADEARVVFALRQRTSPATTSILTDYETHQAFYDYEHVYVYQRLPWHLVQGRDDKYPGNKPRLLRLMSEEVEFIVVGSSNKQTIQELTAALPEPREAQLQVELDPASTDAYSIYHVVR